MLSVQTVRLEVSKHELTYCHVSCVIQSCVLSPIYLIQSSIQRNEVPPLRLTHCVVGSMSSRIKLFGNTEVSC